MKKRKIIFISLAVIAAFLCGFFSVNLLSDSKAYAESAVFSVEQYTDSDYLLKADGSLSSKNIEMFAADVKANKSKYYPELTEVIPRQYLESQEKYATFTYFGNEYGFYVEKQEEYFNVFLIDISYEFSKDDQIHNSDVEYRIYIKIY